jgi:hypothetical protein
VELAFASDDLMVVNTGHVIDFSKDSKDVAEAEAVALYQAYLFQFHMDQFEEGKRELKRKRTEECSELATKYKDKVVSGKVNAWKGGYGFLAGEGEASELGTIFLHISKVSNRDRFYGTPVSAEALLDIFFLFII